MEEQILKVDPQKCQYKSQLRLFYSTGTDSYDSGTV